MASERVTVTITSSIGEDAPLSVTDAMNQILDFFDLLSAAGGEQSSQIDWQLVDIAMRSPLCATAEAVPMQVGVPADPVAQREKAVLASFIEGIVLRSEIPEWMDGPVRDRAKAFFRRNANGIGRMVIQFDEDAPLLVLDQSQALRAVEAIETAEKEIEDAPQADLSRTEIGTIEGDVLLAGPYRGQPAIQIRDRLSGSEVWCVFAPELAEAEGPQHSWAEAWSNCRVLVTGSIRYARDGRAR